MSTCVFAGNGDYTLEINFDLSPRRYPRRIAVWLARLELYRSSSFLRTRLATLPNLTKKKPRKKNSYRF